MSSTADSSPSSDASPLWPRLAVAVAIAVPLLWLFGEALATDAMFGYRDAAHYYYPLYWFVQEHWRAGHLPLWNALENLGQPLAADPTSAAFYPGKLIFFLPLSYEWLYKAYIVGHVALCAATTYWVARRWDASRPAAALAAVCYTFGGSVFMQYANVVFLVGAAWLPIALWGAHRLAMKRDWTGVLTFALAATMMILGGDPEAAYLATLALFGLACMKWRDDVVRAARATPAEEPSESSPEPAPSATPWHSTTPALIGATLLVTFGLSAIQTLPMLDWGRKTERAVFETPRSLWEVPEYLVRSQETQDRIGMWTTPQRPFFPDPPDLFRERWGHFNGLLGVPELYTHQGSVYRFSVGPWRFVELLWPNFYGREFPENRRWGSVVPRESSPWTPSLYFGLIPLLLAATQFSRFAGPLRSRWLTWMALLLAIGSLGTYGIVWLVQEIQYLILQRHAPHEMGEMVGGLYWFATVVLPGFVQFRYPAKLLVLATLAVALLAARGLDRMHSPRTLAILQWGSGIVLGLSLAGLVVAFAILPWWNDWMSRAPASTRFGPLDPAGAHADVLWSLGQACVVSLAVLALASWLASSSDARSRVAAGWLPLALVLFTSVELPIAHGWSVALVPGETFRIGIDPVEGVESGKLLLDSASGLLWEPKLREAYARVVTERRLTLMPLGSQSDANVAADFHAMHRTALVRSPSRMKEAARYDWVVQRSKYNLFFGVRNDRSPGSGMYAERWFRDRQGWRVVSGDLVSAWPRWSWRTMYPGMLPLQQREFSLVEAVAYCPSESSQPGAMPPTAEFEAGGSSIVYRSVDVLTDLPVEAFTQSPLLTSRTRENNAPRPEKFDAAVLPSGYGYRVAIPSEGWVIFPDQYDRDFVCQVQPVAKQESFAAPIAQATIGIRAIYLPAGEFDVRFLYRPWAFYLGATIGLLAWIGLAAAISLWGRLEGKAPPSEMTNAERPKAE